MEPCITANQLRAAWFDAYLLGSGYATSLAKMLYVEHRQSCPVCRQRMSEYTEMARQAEMPELEE